MLSAQTRSFSHRVREAVSLLVTPWVEFQVNGVPEIPWAILSATASVESRLLASTEATVASTVDSAPPLALRLRSTMKGLHLAQPYSHQPLGSRLTSRVPLFARLKRTIFEVSTATPRIPQMSVFRTKSSHYWELLGLKKESYTGSSTGRALASDPRTRIGWRCSLSSKRANSTCSHLEAVLRVEAHRPVKQALSVAAIGWEMPRASENTCWRTRWLTSCPLLGWPDGRIASFSHWHQAWDSSSKLEPRNSPTSGCPLATTGLLAKARSLWPEVSPTWSLDGVA